MQTSMFGLERLPGPWEAVGGLFEGDLLPGEAALSKAPWRGRDLLPRRKAYHRRPGTRPRRAGDSSRSGAVLGNSKATARPTAENGIWTAAGSAPLNSNF